VDGLASSPLLIAPNRLVQWKQFWTFFDVLLTVHLSIFISLFNQLDAQHLFHSKFYFMPLHVSSTCAHHQEVKIALHNLWYYHTYRCDHQCGFRRNKSTINHTFCIRQILEKKWEYNEEVHQLFIDFKKAYDSVRREVLYKILIEFGIPRKLVRSVKMSLTETYSRVRVG